MITYLRGTVVSSNEKRLVLEVGGVGFQIQINGRDAGRMPGRGQEAKIHTYMSVREDDISLFGFLDEEDLEMYRMLINVSGIGPKAGLGILSALSADQLRFAILAGDAKQIAKAPGIGQKTAQKLILELKDKIDIADAFGGEETSAGANLPGGDQESMADAVEALVSLGYSASDALRAVRAVEGGAAMDAQALLKAALRRMM